MFIVILLYRGVADTSGEDDQIFVDSDVTRIRFCTLHIYVFVLLDLN